MTENAKPTTEAGRALLYALGRRSWSREAFRQSILAIEAEAASDCRQADHLGQITQLGEMVDAARREADIAMDEVFRRNEAKAGRR